MGEGACSPSQQVSQGCGNCGTQQRACSASCQWQSWGACTGQGCSPGHQQTQDCGNCGDQTLNGFLPEEDTGNTWSLNVDYWYHQELEEE